MATDTKVKINGTEYLVNVQEAVKAGLLKPVPNYPLQPGDVYVHPRGVCNPFLLIQVTYKQDKYALLGMGAYPNSGDFFNAVRTLEEVKEYLTMKGMVYSRNIDNDIHKMVNERV